MNTAFLLMAQYDAQAIIPVGTIVRDYFPHLSVDKFLRKVGMGEIALPITRIEPGSQKGAKGVHLQDLAKYIDERRAAAQKEHKQLTGQPG
ncbi:pyocin activator PrtN family protein [Polaromonas sp.]|uniref:pyocin activator PrtN family protein n=1 Tax=Polaromonas sp. TaxID=1869339 RepID=UPI00356489CC